MSDIDIKNPARVRLVCPACEKPDFLGTLEETVAVSHCESIWLENGTPTPEFTGETDYDGNLTTVGVCCACGWESTSLHDLWEEPLPEPEAPAEPDPNSLEALHLRLTKAVATLDGIADSKSTIAEAERVEAKASGVRVALQYVEEMLRQG